MPEVPGVYLCGNRISLLRHVSQGHQCFGSSSSGGNKDVCWPQPPFFPSSLRAAEKGPQQKGFHKTTAKVNVASISYNHFLGVIVVCFYSMEGKKKKKKRPCWRLRIQPFAYFCTWPGKVSAPCCHLLPNPCVLALPCFIGHITAW